MKLFFLFVLFSFFFVSQVQALCVVNDRANLRSGPSTKHKKTWEVFKYMPFKVLKKKGEWYSVADMDGQKHWVYAPLVSNNIKCAATINARTNLRSGPGTQYPKVSWSPMQKYYSVKVLKTQKDWIKIQDADGDVAWVHRPLLWIQ